MAQSEGLGIRMAESDGDVKISVTNLSDSQGTGEGWFDRYGNRYGRIEFWRRQGLEWKEITPDPNIHVDSPDEEPTDWVMLNYGNEVSWILDPALDPGIKKGDELRVTIKPSKSSPPSYAGPRIAQIPASACTVTVVVQ
jgi:hypothetical protein